MMHISYRFIGAAFIAASFVILGFSFRVEAQETVPEDGPCVAPSVVQKVQECPQGIQMGKTKGKTKIGTSTKKEEVAKPQKLENPDLTDLVEEMTKSAFTNKREAAKLNILKRELKLLLRLVTTTPDGSLEKADVLKRIADLYKGFYDQYNYMARSLDEKIFAATQKKDKKLAAKYKAQQKKLDKMATDSREKSIKAYVEIRNSFQDFPDYDEILFAIAYEIDQLAGEIDDKKKKAIYRERARTFYKELIRNYPRSKFIPHSWMAFGSYYFDEEKDIERAMASYEKVTEWGEKGNPQFVIAMYYQAWCLFNMQEYPKTIDKFVDVINFAGNNPENREAQAVAKRSRMELVQAFSKTGNPSQAWGFFQKVGAKLSHKMLIKLANLYYDEGHWADAVIVYHKLQALELENEGGNNGSDLCLYQHQITNAVISSKPKGDQLVEIKRQLALYKKFIADPKHDKKMIDRCAQDTLEVSWDHAVKWHVEAVGNESAPGTKDANTMNMTTEMYDAILNTFPDIDNLKIEGFDEKTRPTNYRVAYFKADLLWEMEDWLKCGPAYDAVVEMDPSGEYTSSSAYAAVLCYNKVYVKKRAGDDRKRKHKLKADTGVKKCNKACKKCKAKCKGEGKAQCKADCQKGEEVVLSPRPLSDFEQGTLNAYTRYICVVKKDAELTNIKYRRARIYYEANMLAEAAVLFKEIAMEHSDEELGIFAANLYLDCLNSLGSMVGDQNNPACYDDLADIVDVFIDTSKKPGKALMEDEDFAMQIKSLKVGVLRKKAESLNKRGRNKEAAEVYLKIYRNYKGIYDDRGMCEVLFNTAINMEAARLVMPAINVRESMIELYPKCEHSKKAAYFIGQNYHALQVFQLAADNYKKFATKYSGEDEAPVALQNAVTFYIGLGKYDEAWKTISLFEKNYKSRKPDQAATVFFSAGFMHYNEAKKGNDSKIWSSVRKHYTKYLRSYSKVKALHEQVQAHVFIGDSYWNDKKSDLNKAEKAYKKALSIFDANAMEQVAENKDKAAMLIAAAKARYFVAERKFHEFQKVKFPEFKPKKDVSKPQQKWWDAKIGPEKVKLAQEVDKYNKLLVRWGEMKRKEYNKEVALGKASIQFEYWLEHSFKPWMEKKDKVVKEANELFAKVVEMHVPEWEMAAAARAGDMQMEFMQALFDAPIPPAFKDDEELKGIYQGAMDEKGGVYKTAAIQLFGHCLNVSTKVRWFNQNSLRCEARLNELDPLTYPLSAEIRTTPKNELDYWAVPEVIVELETAAQKKDKALVSSANEISTAGKEAE